MPSDSGKTLEESLEPELREAIAKVRLETRQAAEIHKEARDAWRAKDIPDDRATMSVQDYKDFVALKYAEYTTPTVLRNPEQATAEERAEERERRLCAPTTRHRVISQVWPRDVDGKPMDSEEMEGCGKNVGNGFVAWGETLFDFYAVNRIADAGSFVTYTSGSRIADWMKKNGEPYAEDQLFRAEREAEPREVHPWPMYEMLKDVDHRLRRPFCRSRIQNKRVEFNRFPPFAPHLRDASKLQERLPLGLLPKTLIVHDPGLCLSATKSESTDEDWDDSPDIVSVYRLSLSHEGENNIKEEEAEIRVRQEKDEADLRVFLDNPSSHTRPLGRSVMCIPLGSKAGPCAPATVFLHEPRMDRRPCSEAHVYISPKNMAGRGNHSYAYDVEWEVPRSILVDPILCKSCVVEAGLRIRDEEDAKSKGKSPVELSGEIIETVVDFPGTLVSVCDSEGENLTDDMYGEVTFDIEPPSRTVTRKYVGPVRVIDTGVKYQDPEDGPLCEHLELIRRQPETLTANVEVVAKLSHKGDTHLDREAKNYQKFPAHFFKHFTGYNIVHPFHEPVPLGALVPQFYGYYVPDDSVPARICDRDVKGSGMPGKEGAKTWRATELEYEYRSPILLIEDCGEPICPLMPGDELSIDEKLEIAAMFLRMHKAGWYHGSPYTRNVLYQSGPLDTYLLARTANAYKERPDFRHTRFRLIDFGRSGDEEEEEVEKPQWMKTSGYFKGYENRRWEGDKVKETFGVGMV